MDPLVLAVAAHRAGRRAKGMGKIELFTTVRPAGWLLTRMGHIPVDRKSATPADALRPAADAIRAGQLLALWPEGTTNRHHPERGLLPAKTGAARLALLAGCPVIPVGQWGPQHLIAGKGRLKLFPRTRCTVRIGEPISAEEIRRAGRTGSTGEMDLRAITDLFMARIGAEVVAITGDPATGQVHRPDSGQQAA